ncbi:MAG: adenosylmethionine decarboxylase, partial [Bdellovibrionales bacterium]|nr:adenosylmethionine decarboxylase [Bdellovibrionales bacterium]
IFSFENNYQADSNDETLEVLLYHICSEVSKFFINGSHSSEIIRGVLKLDKLFPGFTFDDFVFDPCGYSLNGINGSDYMTIHITPEESISYVSLETNIGAKFIKNLLLFVNIFNPKSFDIISFNNMMSDCNYDDYLLTQNASYQLDSGYDLCFNQYININLSNQKIHLLT